MDAPVKRAIWKIFLTGVRHRHGCNLPLPQGAAAWGLCAVRGPASKAALLSSHTRVRRFVQALCSPHANHTHARNRKRVLEEPRLGGSAQPAQRVRPARVAEAVELVAALRERVREEADAKGAREGGEGVQHAGTRALALGRSGGAEPLAHPLIWGDGGSAQESNLTHVAVRKSRLCGAPLGRRYLGPGTQTGIRTAPRSRRCSPTQQACSLPAP